MPERDNTATWRSICGTGLDADVRSNTRRTELTGEGFDRLIQLQQIYHWSSYASLVPPTGGELVAGHAGRVDSLCVHYGLTPGPDALLTRERYSWKLHGHAAVEWAYVPCLASETNSVSAALDIIERRIGGAS